MSLDGQLEVAVASGGVELSFTVENAGVEPVELAFDSGQVADFAVRDGDEEIWRWSDGRLFAQAIQTATLAPGESFTETARWPDPPAGEYTASATLETRDVAVEAIAEFSV